MGVNFPERVMKLYGSTLSALREGGWVGGCQIFQKNPLQYSTVQHYRRYDRDGVNFLENALRNTRTAA